MEQKTHLKIDPTLVGAVTSIDADRAVVELVATQAMVADDRGLVHGGFTFGLADYAAMVAVGDPTVVLGAADCRFKGPVRVGERMIASAQVESVDGRKRSVTVTVRVGDTDVFVGTFSAFVLDRHVLDG